MTRAEAIDALIGVWLSNDGEFCCGQREHDESREEMKQALAALGVSEEEMDL